MLGSNGFAYCEPNIELISPCTFRSSDAFLGQILLLSTHCVFTQNPEPFLVPHPYMPLSVARCTATLFLEVTHCFFFVAKPELAL